QGPRRAAGPHDLRLGRGAAQLEREADPDHERPVRHPVPEPARHRDQQDRVDDEPAGGRLESEQPGEALIPVCRTRTTSGTPRPPPCHNKDNEWRTPWRFRRGPYWSPPARPRCSRAVPTGLTTATVITGMATTGTGTAIRTRTTAIPTTTGRAMSSRGP